MAFRGDVFPKSFRLLPLLVLLLSVASARPVNERQAEARDTGAARESMGTLTVDGVERPVFYEVQAGVPKKYFLDARGTRVDLADHQRKQAQATREKYGVFGKRLFDTLAALPAAAEVDVQLTFAGRALPGPLKNRKLTKEEAAAHLQASFQDGIEALRRRIGPLLPGDAAFHGRNGLRLRLPKSELLKLKQDPHIQSLELPVDPRREKVLRQAPLEESFLGSGWSSGGLHFPDDCGEEYACGSGMRIGVLERNPIWNSDSADHLDGSWFVKRPGTPVNPRHPHGLWTSSILRNSGPGLTGSAFNGGGAYNADISLSYPVAPESTMQDAYDWLLNDQNVYIVNHSWRFPRYLGGVYEAEANEFERQMDMATMWYPYVLNVQAAGNSGDTADGGENDACVDSSAVHNPPGWTAEQCQRVAWWNHNGLIVGAVDNDSARSSFSAFRNGPENNEAPHVMARGAGVELPWMTPFDSSTVCPTDTAVANADGPLCGTSFAAPAVAALASHVAGVGWLTFYPEVTKNILLASATSRPVQRQRWHRWMFDSSSYKDRTTGTGIPHQPTADSIARNEHYGSNFSAGVYGFKKFTVMANSESFDEWDTITISHPQGGVLHFYMTWVGNPSNVTPGTRYAPDDMDMYLMVEGTMQSYSVSYQNTSEYISYPLHPDSSTTFLVRKYLYNRVLDENSPIWGSLVWTYTPPAVVEIHSPLDSSYTNQNLFPVEWSIDGVPDTTWTTDYVATEGPNVITRCYENYYFCDSVTVILDQTPPVVGITSPAFGTITPDDSILVRWTVDAIPDSQVYALVPGPQEIIVSGTDLAGNVGFDTIEVTRHPFQANAASASTSFTYQFHLLDGRASTGLSPIPLSYRWRQIAGQSVIVLDSTQSATAFLSRASDTLKFELKVGDVDGIYPPAYDTVTVVVHDPNSTHEFMQVLEAGKSLQDGSISIAVTDPGLFPSYNVSADTARLSGTITSEDTIGAIHWSTQHHSGNFNPASHEWMDLDIPLEPGDNRLTLVYHLNGEIAVDRLLLILNTDSSMEVGPLWTNPEVLIADSLTQLKFFCRIEGSGISSVELLRIADASDTTLTLLLDNGSGQDSVASDSIFTGAISLTPGLDSTYRFRARITKGLDTTYSPFLTFFPQKKMTDSAFDEMQISISSADSVYSNRLSTMDTVDAMKSVVDWLISQPNVEIAGIAPGEKAICWQFTNGIHALISLAPEGTMGTSGPVTVNGISPFQSNFSGKTIERPWGDTVAALYGAGGFINGDAFDQLSIRLGEDSLLNVNWPDPTIEAPTLEFWKNVGSAKLVNISTHGNTFGYYPYRKNAALATLDEMGRGQTKFSNGAFLTLNSGIQVFNDGPSDNRQYIQQLMDAGEFTVVTADGFPKLVFYITHKEETEIRRIYVGITPNFFKKYTPKMPKSLVFLNACRSLYPKAISPTFWDVFKSKGSLAMVGYDDYVQSTFAGISTHIIQGSLLRGESLKSGIHNSTQRWSRLSGGDAGRCDWESPSSCLVVKGDSNAYLAQGLGLAAGPNGDGQLGNGNIGEGSGTFASISGSKQDWVALVASSNSFSIGLDVGRRVWSWGINNTGQLGSGDISPDNRDEPGLVESVSGASAISAGVHQAFALKVDGTVVGWGSNFYGQLGKGDTLSAYNSTQMSGIANAVSVKAGYVHTLVLLADGTVRATGDNSNRALGTTCSPTCQKVKSPEQVPGLQNVVAIGAGARHSLALRADGTVWSWGSNTGGALGLGPTVQYATSPTQLPGLSNIVAIEATESGGVALRADGSIYTWGVSSNTAQVVSGIGPAISIGASIGGIFSIEKNRKMKVWGSATHGQFGIGGATNAWTPVEVPGMTNVFSVKSGYHSLGIKVSNP